jgi:PadR family transcriptional regulator, regulatory protein PadR
VSDPFNLGEFEQLVLLAILRLDSTGAYGVSIREEIAANTKREPSPGAIYTTLDRLEKKGLVGSKPAETTPERRGRPRRYYRVSAAGVRSLKQATNDFHRMSRGLALLERGDA